MIRHTPAALMPIVDYKTKYKMVSTRKIFTSSTTKVDSEPQNGSNDDITNQYECIQTLDVSAGTLNIHAGTSLNPTKEGLRVQNSEFTTTAMNCQV
ncbi:hypothetical protein Tco_0434064 [Tanacetum coccineum]